MDRGRGGSQIGRADGPRMRRGGQPHAASRRIDPCHPRDYADAIRPRLQAYNRKQFPMRSLKLRAAALLATAALPLSYAQAQLTVLAPPPGYLVSSLELGQPFGGSLAFHPADPDRFYASIGAFGAVSILRADAGTQTTATVAGPFGNIGGLAVLANGDLLITENYTSDTVLRARDLNTDGDFLDAGEMTELLAPILHDNVDFTGAQIAVAPSGGASGVPAGAAVVQTADGQTSSELLVVRDPATATPVYRPAGGAYFSGFQYNGGLAFTASGHLISGDSEFDPFTFTSKGRITALVNSNADEDIDPGESHVLVDQAALPSGLTDLAVRNDGRVFFTDFSGTVGSFPLPSNLLAGSAAPAPFAQTNGVYLSTARLDRSGPGARLYVGGYTPGFVQATNLAVFTLAPPTAADGWSLYE